MERRRKKPIWSELTIVGKVVAVFSDLLFTVAFVIVLYLIYQLYWTAVPAYYEQQELAASIKWDIPEDANVAATPLAFPPCDNTHSDDYKKLWGDNWQSEYNYNWNAPEKEKTMIGRSYIPKFGKDYSRNIVEGTDKARILDRQGFGHYQTTVMPGCVGNFSAAAHRDGYGAPLGDVEEIVSNDDALIVRTRQFWYVYKYTGHEVVVPEDAGGILPVPYKSVNKPVDRLLTYTTCHPRWSLDRRYILHAKFDYWATVVSGVPKEMLAVGTHINY